MWTTLWQFKNLSFHLTHANLKEAEEVVESWCEYHNLISRFVVTFEHEQNLIVIEAPW